MKGGYNHDKRKKAYKKSRKRNAQKGLYNSV